MTVEATPKPDARTLLGFGAVVLLGGTNFVAVRFSNRGLPPFFGAAVRFLAASMLLFAYMTVRHLPALSKREWKGALIYGFLNFAAFYALAYWALLSLPSSVAAVIAACVPLLTLLLAVMHKVERFSIRGVMGATIAIAGIAVMVGVRSETSLPVGPILAVLGAALCGAEAGVVIKKLPTGHPVTTNAIAMLIGSLLLLGFSGLVGESWSVPADRVTLAALGYLVVLGSIGLFMLYLVTLKRWTASGMSYVFVLMPIVAALMGSWLAGEVVSTAVMVGGLIILAGVYVGALSGGKAAFQEDALAPRH